MAPSQAAFPAQIPAGSHRGEQSLPKLNSGTICHQEKQSPLQIPLCQPSSLLISLMGNLSLTVCGKMLTSPCP